MSGLTTLYFDCFSGASGDMILGALIDAGVPLDEVRRALGTLAVEPDAIWTDRVTRAGISATRFCVRGEHAPEHLHSAEPVGHAAHASHGHGPAGRGHTHEHASGNRHAHAPASGEGHPHRTLDEIGALIDRSALSEQGKVRAKHLFERLGVAEAAIHGLPLHQVHLHEVGALDSVIDIVGTVFAIEWLGVGRVVSSPLNVGGGTVRSAHGVYPVPAPATIRLLQDAPIYASRQQVELVTPTGALLVTDYASEYGPVPAMRVRAVGYGAGSRDLPDTPNVVRVVLGDSEATAAVHIVSVIEAEIDDMNPQIFGALMDRLLADGALDVFYTPIQMKKNRPGTLLTIVATPAARESLVGTVFRETTTIGVRFREMSRECLDRETIVVDTPYGAVRIKVARRDGEIMNVSPEFDDCLRLATEHGRPIKELQALAIKSFMSTGRR